MVALKRVVGGGRDNIVLAYQFFSTEEAAQAACDKVKVLAKELQEQSQKNHGEHCLNQMEWLEERGLDSDYLPEVDGPSEYNVIVSEGLPESTYGCRVYS